MTSSVQIGASSRFGSEADPDISKYGNNRAAIFRLSLFGHLMSNLSWVVMELADLRSIYTEAKVEAKAKSVHDV